MSAPLYSTVPYEQNGPTVRFLCPMPRCRFFFDRPASMSTYDVERRLRQHVAGEHPDATMREVAEHASTWTGYHVDKYVWAEDIAAQVAKVLRENPALDPRPRCPTCGEFGIVTAVDVGDSQRWSRRIVATYDCPTGPHTT